MNTNQPSPQSLVARPFRLGVSITQPSFVRGKTKEREEWLSPLRSSGAAPGPPLRVLRGGRQSWRWQVKAVLFRIFIFLLVGALAFAATRALRSGARLEREGAAAFEPAAAGDPGSPGGRPWIHGSQPAAEPRAGTPDAEPESIAARRLERGLDARESGPESHHLQGIIYLRAAWDAPVATAAALREAERELASALAADPRRAGTWNDLAAVYLTWAAQLDRPRLLLDAYAATQAARALEPDLPEARFNEALALEGLGLFQQAAARLAGSWPSGVDAAAIVAKRQALAELDPVALRDSYLAELDQAAQKGGVDLFLRRADRFPGSAQRWAEEILLPRWAGAHLAGDAAKAGQWLALARALGGRLAARSAGTRPADPLLGEAVAAIDGAAAAGDRGRLELLARGHQAFGEGIEAFPAQLAEAEASFHQAERSLAAAATPFAAWGAFSKAPACTWSASCRPPWSASTASTRLPDGIPAWRCGSAGAGPCCSISWTSRGRRSTNTRWRASWRAPSEMAKASRRWVIRKPKRRRSWRSRKMPGAFWPRRCARPGRCGRGTGSASCSPRRNWRSRARAACR